MIEERDTAPGDPTAAAGEDYDELPYPSMPFAFTQPSRLAALATLYGLDAPNPACASVLELGCASGGNIIPMAARHSQARFLGVDLSQRHIADGMQRARALELTNIELRQADLTEADFGSRRFDYILCHGVFSWVPRAAQDAILRICRDALADDGLAIISYNVLPGWHLRGVVRDLCLSYAGSGPPRERVARARKALAEIAQASSETEPYGLLLRDEARKCAQLPSAYILGEFLAAENAPLHFRDFVERTRTWGLNFLCEADLGASIAQNLPLIAERIDAADQPARLADEQRKDFVTGRTFRRSVLVKAGRRILPPSGGRLHSLHVSWSRQREATGDDAVDCAISRLRDAYPGTMAVRELIADDDGRVCEALLALVMMGQATISALPLAVGRADVERPKIWPPARIEAAAKQPWLTSLSHEAVPLRALPAELIAWLDGRCDRQTLAVRVAEAIKAGKIAPAGAETAESYIQRALAQLAGYALLEPG
jgi:SAM-dependent methyltransferase